MYYLCKPQFYYIKVACKMMLITRTFYETDHNLQDSNYTAVQTNIEIC